VSGEGRPGDSIVDAAGLRLGIVCTGWNAASLIWAREPLISVMTRPFPLGPNVSSTSSWGKSSSGASEAKDESAAKAAGELERAGAGVSRLLSYWAKVVPAPPRNWSPMLSCTKK